MPCPSWLGGPRGGGAPHHHPRWTEGAEEAEEAVVVRGGQSVGVDEGVGVDRGVGVGGGVGALCGLLHRLAERLACGGRTKTHRRQLRHQEKVRGWVDGIRD